VHVRTRSITASKCISTLARLRPASLHDHGLQVHLQTHLIVASHCIFEFNSVSASKCISKLARSRPPSESPDPLYYGLQVRTIMASKFISKLARSWPPNASLSSLDLSLQVHIQTRSIRASKCISEFTRSTSPSSSQTHSIEFVIKERWRLYGDTGVTEVDRVTGSIYSADPGVDRHHLISISSYHTMKIHTLSFSTFGLTCSVQDFVDPCNCMDSHGRVV